MRVLEILERLVAFPSVVGRPNSEIVDWIRAYLEPLGARVHILPGPEGDRANLFATLGPASERGYVLSGHMDVVPADEPTWTSSPFQLRADGDRFYGRGATDMKGYLAAALAAAPKFAGAELARPIHFAFSYDEEAGCRGAPHMLARLSELCAPPLGAIIGEPSGLRAIRAHKGKIAVRVTIEGRSGHSSRPDQGLNAIHAMSQILTAAADAADELARGPLDPDFDPPYSSLQVGTIKGGRALNIIPDFCQIEFEARSIAGVDPAGLLAPVRRAAETLTERGFGVKWQEMSAYPALSQSKATPLVQLVEDLTRRRSLAAVSYGTEAGLFQKAGVDAVICGPGDIVRAHKADEYILMSELEACQSMLEALAAPCSA